MRRQQRVDNANMLVIVYLNFEKVIDKIIDHRPMNKVPDCRVWVKQMNSLLVEGA